MELRRALARQDDLSFPRSCEQLVCKDQGS